MRYVATQDSASMHILVRYSSLPTLLRHGISLTRLPWHGVARVLFLLCGGWKKGSGEYPIPFCYKKFPVFVCH